jgi:NAD(P)H-nitrite reductase large subunit
MSPRVVIIGAGTAGTRLAQLLDGRYDVQLLGDEGFYDRGRLTEYVAGRAAEPVVGKADPVTALAVDRAAKVVAVEDGRRIPYDRLVFATGAEPVEPPIDGFRTLRTARDAIAIVQAADQVRRAVVLGGGVLGVETACALRERGVAVTLVHEGESLLDKTVRATAGRRITRAVRELGIEVLLNATVASTESRDGRFRAAHLASGRAVFGELLIATCGVKPRATLAAAAGLSVGATGGIAVDQTFTTPADPAVHAIGDCAEYEGRTTGTVASAWDQAEILARHLDDLPGEVPGTEVVRLTAGGLDVLVLGADDDGG